MLDIYEEKRMEIRKAKIVEDYELMSVLCVKYLDNLKDTFQFDEFQWANYNLAVANKKLGLVESAYNLGKTAKDYCAKIDNNFVMNCWLIGECADELGCKKESVEMFDICIDYYNLVGEKNYALISMFNRSKVLNDVKGMKKYIGLYEELNFKIIVNNIGDMKKNDVLEEMRNGLNKSI